MINQRMCVACRNMADKAELVRAEVSGTGRGAYIHANAECFALAVKKRGLEKSFKRAVSKSVYDEVEKQIGKKSGNN